MHVNEQLEVKDMEIKRLNAKIQDLENDRLLLQSELTANDTEYKKIIKSLEKKIKQLEEIKSTKPAKEVKVDKKEETKVEVKNDK